MKMSNGKDKMLIKVLEKWAKEKKNKVFVEFEGEGVTYSRFNDTINSIANGLIAMGVKKGQPVCIMLPNCLEFLYAGYGIIKAGGSSCP